MHYWKLTLFGGLSATNSIVCHTRFRTQKIASLLAYLALHRETQAREALIEIFWPNTDLKHGQTNLRAALASLRRQLEPPGTPPNAVLEAGRSQVRLSAFVGTDVDAFEKAIQQGNDAQAVSVYEGELLRGYYDDWIFPLRRHYETLYIAALERYLAQLADAHRWTEAVAAAQQGTQITEHWDEGEVRLVSLSACLMERELRTAPQRARAKKATTNKPKSLATSSDLVAPTSVRPDSAAPDSVQKDSVRTPFPAKTQTFLPPTTDRFFGRQSEISQLIELWSRQERLLSLTGCGGIGKSRLALEVARVVADQNSAVGKAALIALVPMASLSSVGNLDSTALDTLGIGRRLDATPWQLLIETLQGQPAFLVLDNAEHLLPALAPLLERLLREAPTVRLMVTSRTRLGIPNEREVPLSPLPLASPDETTPSVLLQHAGVALFAERAARSRPDFAITPGNAVTVSALCRKLDGLPLAIELMAARASVLSPTQMLMRLEERFSFLTTSRRTLLHRHQSLHATLDWSYQLLPPNLGSFWRQISVFRGGFTAEAASEVAQEPHALHQLAQLRAASLLSGGEQGDEIRFSLLETLREFGAAQLDDSELKSLPSRHAAYFVSWAENAATQATGSQAAQWIARSVDESENLHAALEWSLVNQVTMALRLALSMEALLTLRGQFLEAADVLERAIKRVEILPKESLTQEMKSLWRVALAHLGHMELMLDRISVSQAHLEKAAELCRGASDDMTLAFALGTLIPVFNNLQEHYEYEKGWNIGHEALSAARRHAEKTGDQRMELYVLVHFTWLWPCQPTGEVNEEMTLETLQLAQKLKDERSLAYALQNKGQILWEKDQFKEASLLFAESLTLCSQVGDSFGQARAHWGIGYSALRLNQLAKARENLRQAMELGFAVGSRWGARQMALHLAEVALAEGRVDSALPAVLAADILWYFKKTCFGKHLDATLTTLRATLGAERFAHVQEEANTWTYEELIEKARAL